MSILAVQIRAVKGCPCRFGLEADVCSAKRHVRYGPKADIFQLFDHFIRLQQHRGRHSKAERTRSVPSATVFC